MKKIFTLLAALIFTTAIMAQNNGTLANVGDKAPDFTLTKADGSKLKLSDLKGKVVWINFFATWCPPCRKELPVLQKDVYQKLKGNNDFVLLVVGRQHDRATLDKFAKDNNFDLPFYPDAKREIFDKYAQQSIPRNFVVDKNGKIAVASIGFTPKEFGEIIEKVDELLDK